MENTQSKLYQSAADARTQINSVFEAHIEPEVTNSYEDAFLQMWFNDQPWSPQDVPKNVRASWWNEVTGDEKTGFLSSTQQGMQLSATNN